MECNQNTIDKHSTSTIKDFDLLLVQTDTKTLKIHSTFNNSALFCSDIFNFSNKDRKFVIHTGFSKRDFRTSDRSHFVDATSACQFCFTKSIINNDYCSLNGFWSS